MVLFKSMKFGGGGGGFPKLGGTFLGGPYAKDYSSCVSWGPPTKKNYHLYVAQDSIPPENL